MNTINCNPDICKNCETLDCLVRCQYMEFSPETARVEKDRLLAGEDTKVLTDCLTCYACEEYCPNDNHPFYLLVQRQEEKGIEPAPTPITSQQLAMMRLPGKMTGGSVTPPVINMCCFPVLEGCIRGKLFEGASTISGNDLFCNIMWLHFARNSAIRERLPTVIDNIWTGYLKDSGVDELVCFHDECYGAYTHLAPAFGIEVPFKTVHLYEFIAHRLEQLRGDIRPLNARVAYQRPCSNRLIPRTDLWVDRIFDRIGVTRPQREYDRENALCCGGVVRAHQKDILADEIQEKNIADMVGADVQYCVFNCPVCLFTLGDAVAEKGIVPILMSDLCQMALE